MADFLKFLRFLCLLWRSVKAGVTGVVVFGVYLVLHDAQGACDFTVSNRFLTGAIWENASKNPPICTVGGGEAGIQFSIIIQYNTVLTKYRCFFQSCTNLTEIHYEGTVDQWHSISLGSGWDTSSGEYTIYCTDGEISKDGIITMY